jgi:hypothetical protein
VNEELQSTNEELHTANEQLRHSSDELTRANAFFENLLGSFHEGLIVVDADFSCTRGTARPKTCGAAQCRGQRQASNGSRHRSTGRAVETAPPPLPVGRLDVRNAHCHGDQSEWTGDYARRDVLSVQAWQTRHGGSSRHGDPDAGRTVSRRVVMKEPVSACRGPTGCGI